MLDRIEIIKHFHEAIEQGSRYDDPYLLYSFSPFAEDLYKKILANLPPDEAYMELRHGDAIRSDGTSSRLVFPLKQERIRPTFAGEAREFWLDFSDILRDAALRDLFKRALEPELRKRFRAPVAEITALPAPMLMRDLGQYRIRIHPDIDAKVITSQYYLPQDNSQRHLGTSIYRRRPEGKFEFVRKIEFMPRAAYCFAVSKESWHAVDPIAAGETPRNSIMLIYFRLAGIDY